MGQARNSLVEKGHTADRLRLRTVRAGMIESHLRSTDTKRNNMFLHIPGLVWAETEDLSTFRDTMHRAS